MRAKKPKRLPTVLSKDEVHRLLVAMPEKGAHRLIVELLYGTGMRISESCRLRVCDMDFDRSQIVIRESKGSKDRVTMLPHSLEERLKAQVEFVRLRHEHDVENGYDIRTEQLLGHKNLETTMIDTHVMAKPGLGVRSPLDG